MKFLSYLILAFLAFDLGARSTPEYLPADADLNPDIPAPETVLGWEVGDWHVSHDKLVQYLRILADSSSRVSIRVIGYTYEDRPLLQLIISSAGNQHELETLRQHHLGGSGPLVIWLGYSVHGNEPSGSNAAMLAAYYLTASRSSFVRELLDGTVVLIDPSINPDGLNRFASWANSNSSLNPVADPTARLHVQNWPRGRGNHYWFDLNRDWLPLTHASSRARVAEFHRWLPHVLTDHHEQTGYPGFFFQPGVPSRQNPLTPAENLELTRALADYHSKVLDEAGQPHFTEDEYDDFYFGKGSTYPDINGSVGILFEQKAIRGQELSTGNGTETFRNAIANQLRMTLSTLRGSWELRNRLKTYQAGFHQGMMEQARDRDYVAWVVGDDGDPARARAFLEALDLHGIEFQPLGESLRRDSHEFEAGHAWIVPVQQRQFGLLESLMEQRTEFRDNTFYDVSAWTLPLAYNLPFTKVSKLPRTDSAAESSSGLPPDEQARAWAVPWNQMEAPAVLQKMLDVDARVRTATRPFSAQTGSGLRAFSEGTFVIQAGIQNPEAMGKIVPLLSEAALSGLSVYSLPGTRTATGPDLGARHFKRVRPVNPLIIGGQGTSAYGVGEQWFLLDRRLGIPAPITEIAFFKDIDLREYSHILMADGNYDELLRHEARIARWVRDGGVLVAVGRAAKWAENLCFGDDTAACETSAQADSEPKTPAPRAYSEFERDKADQVIGGAIVASVLDLSHPLAFGYERHTLPLFRRGTVELTPSMNSYSTPVHYGDEPLLAGFIGAERLGAIKGQAAVIAERQGRGLVVRFANNPLFRGFWRGTEKLFINALYFGQVVEETELPETAGPR